MNGYPYPVLTEVDSAYKADINFNIEFSKYACKDDKIVLSLGVELNSETLKNHIVEGNAKLVIKVVTGIRSLMFRTEELCDNLDLEINSEDIRANDTVAITAFVVANKVFTFTATDEMEDYFGENFSLGLKKGDVLAISNSESLNYNTTSNDFIMISSSDEMKGKGIKISLKGENHICILVSPEFKRAYATLNDPKISAVLGSHLVFEAFVHTLVEIAQEKEDHSGKEWYRLFVQALAVTGDSVDEFKLKAMDDRNVDMAYIYEVAQEMISNSLETTAIKIRGQEEKK